MLHYIAPFLGMPKFNNNFCSLEEQNAQQNQVLYRVAQK